MSPGEIVHRVREPAGEPQGALILMHGRGTDESDLFPVLDFLDPEKRLLGVSPGAPIMDEPPGGKHWYRFMKVGHPEPESFRLTFEQLAQYLDDELEQHDIPWEKTVLGGFSQGAVMSYACGLGQGRPRPAGILALSGFMPQVEGWSPDPATAAGLPVFHAHGVADEVIPVQFAREARERLTELGADLTYRETPMGHAIDPRLLPEAQEWVAERTA